MSTRAVANGLCCMKESNRDNVEISRSKVKGLHASFARVVNLRVIPQRTRSPILSSSCKKPLTVKDLGFMRELLE